MNRSNWLPLAICFSLLQANLLAAQLLAHPPSAPGDLISKACEQAFHKTFCIDLLKSDRNSAKADLRGLAFIALRVAEKNATATSILIKQTLNNTDYSTYDGLSNCGDLYVVAVELIEDAISSLVSDGYSDVDKLAKAAAANLDTCDQSISAGEGGAPSSVVANNREIRQLINTALTIVRVAASAKAP